MKKSIVKVIMTVVFLFNVIASYTSAKEQTKEKKFPFPFYSNCCGIYEGKSEQIISKPDGSSNFLELHRKYNFTYDEGRRLIRKEAYKWNKSNKRWMPDYTLTFTYDHNRIETEYTRWDKQKKVFSPATEKIVYMINNQEVIAYTGYKRKTPSNEWELVTDLSDLQPCRLGLESDMMLARKGR